MDLAQQGSNEINLFFFTIFIFIMNEMTKKGVNFKKPKIEMHGGDAGTSGNEIVLIEDMFGMIKATFDTIIGGVDLASSVVHMGTNMGTNWKNAGAPGAKL